MGGGGIEMVWRREMRGRRSRRWRAALLALPLVLSACSTPPVPDEQAKPAPTQEADSWAELMRYVPGLEAQGQPFSQPVASVQTAGANLTITPDATAYAAASTLATGSPAPGSDPSQASVSTPAWHHTNVGLSFEMSDLADPRWEPGASSLDILMSHLDGPVLRFGGNSVDRRVWFTGSDEPAPEWAKATVTPEDFARLARFAEATNATVVLDLDLGHKDAERAASMAEAASLSLGERLLGVTLGNEPNGFFLESQPQYAIRDASWSTEEYQAEIAEYERVIHARVPDLPISGPGTFDAKWWRAFVAAGLSNTVSLNSHWYPLWSCPGRQGTTDAAFEPTVANLVAPSMHEKAERIVGMAADEASKSELPLWMTETGSTSCVGSNESSRTHAQALWTVDYAVHAAELGVSMMAFHSMLGACSGGAPMSVVCDTGKQGQPATPDLNGQANYLALLFLAQLREGAVVPVEVSGGGDVYAYGVAAAEGLDVVVVNMADPAAVGSSPVEVVTPAGLELREASQLSGPSLDARNESRLLPLGPADVSSVSELAPGSATLLRFDSA